jgi:two-component system nitrate/nitrite response regulator NarL
MTVSALVRRTLMIPLAPDSTAKKRRIRVFVVDDHALFREGLIRLLNSDASMSVVGSAASAGAALEMVPGTDPDVVILDYNLGRHTAQHVVSGLRERGFRGRSLVVTAGLPDADAVDLLRLGASGIFMKSDSPEALHRNIREVAAGRVLIDQRHFQRLAQPDAPARSAHPALTDRERRVLSLLLEGQTNKQIGASLSISESAAKAALQQLFAKTGVRTRSQLVRVALERQMSVTASDAAADARSDPAA